MRTLDALLFVLLFGLILTPTGGDKSPNEQVEVSGNEVNMFEDKKVICDKCKRADGNAEHIDISSNTYLWRCQCGEVKEVIFSTNTPRAVEP